MHACYLQENEVVLQQVKEEVTSSQRQYKQQREEQVGVVGVCGEGVWVVGMCRCGVVEVCGWWDVWVVRVCRW